MLEWSVGEITKKWAKLTPDKVAFICDDKPATYKQLNDNANRVAHYLQEKGLKKGDRIAALTRNCEEMLDVFFAAAKLGLILVPMNFRLYSKELEYQLNNAGVRLLAFHDSFTDNVEPVRSSTKVEEFIYIKSGASDAPGCPEWATDFNDILKDFSADEPVVDEPVSLTDPITILYTSGTTGAPKGAVLTHLQTYFKNFQIMTYANMAEDDVYLSTLPLFHSGGLYIQTVPTLCRGATAVTFQQLDPRSFCQAIEKYKVTMILALTSIWRIIIRSGELEGIDTSNLKFVLGGGERTPVNMYHELEKYGIKMQTLFGQTENSCMMVLPKKDMYDKMGSIGLPGFFTDLWIQDAEGNRAAPNQVGEIVGRGPVVMDGYWNMPEMTAAAITNGVLHTGDLGYQDEDGYFYIVDRAKDMYRSGGENVYPAEIEKLLSEHPKISDVSIIGVNDEKWGETGKAFIVPKEPNDLVAIDEIHEFLAGKIAKYKWPSHVQILDELPMTASGKIKKVELKEKYGATLNTE